MLFRWKGALLHTCILLLIVTTSCGQSQSNARSYDTNDWIPVSRPNAPGETNQGEPVQKRPAGRVLNLPAQDEKRFFAEQQTPQNQQQYRPPPEAVQQPELVQRPPNYEPNGQQILLPPQLQSLITQGPQYLSPQNINQQLLPQNQDYTTLPQNFTDFNSRDVAQNINLGLYNQKQPQQVKQQNNEQPEVQLLYVPLENLQQQRGQRQQVVFPTEQAPQIYNTPPQQYQQHKQVQLDNIEQDFIQQALQAQKLQEQFQHNVQPQQSYRRPFPEVISQPQTTVAPKKRKPHQPPLAVYMGTEGQQELKIGDVLSLLKDAKSISVQDSIGPDSPHVFVGPSHLAPPEGYAKFDLPYLSSIENNRVERKVDQLPFFVAPLSYKAPSGYSKIPFPAPHVGSVVINHLKAIPSTTEQTRYHQTLEDTSSHIPFTQPEVSTVRPTRQRQRHRNNYSTTIQTPVPDNIPYGPLPTRVTPEVQQPHSVQQSLISPNPYGPTKFVQSTTPAIYDKPVTLPDEIFATKNRFSTTSNYNNVHSTRHYSSRPEVIPTEPTLSSSTLSPSLLDDKYTVLEQFPIRGNSGKAQQEETIPHRGRQHSRRPTQEPYQENSQQKTALPLVSSTHISNQEFETPYRQFVQTTRQQENYEVPTKQTYHEVPTRTRQRVTDNYQSSQVTQSSPVQQVLSNEQIPTQQSHQEFELPVRQVTQQSYQEFELPARQVTQQSHQEFEPPARQVTQQSHQEFELPARQVTQQSHQEFEPPARQVTQQSHQEFEPPARQVTQQSQIRNQQPYSENYDRDLPNYNTQRARGKINFTPEYFQEYDQHVNERTTESLVTVTKEPIIEYKIPEPQRYQEYYQDEPRQEVVPSKQEYTLPSKLPAISPQLPGLINSLQDQQLRPLLAPLLIPPSEQPPVQEESNEESREEYYSSSEPESALVHIPSSTTTSSTTTTTTTTQAPITETTTQFKRTRSRQRGTRPTASYDYVSSTSSPRRPSQSSQYRGRRPYNGQPRQEYKPRENYPVSSTTSEIIETTRVNRNRHAPQRQYVSSTTEHAPQRQYISSTTEYAPQRQYISSTTEQPRRSPISRLRFRTRGRPTTTEEEYIQNITPENVYKQPIQESEDSSPLLHQNVQLSTTDHEGNVQDEPQRSQKEQGLVYIQSTSKPIEQEGPVYIPKQQFISTTLEPLHYSTIAATGPENNFVPDIVHDQPTLLSSQREVKYNNPTETNLNSQEDYSSKETIVQAPQYSPDVKEPSTTEYTRTRQRIRGNSKPRTRVNPVTVRYQPSYSTTHKTTTEGKKDEEFYGFFRQPNFAKSQTERPEFVSSPSPSPRPNFAYLSRSTEEPQQAKVYIDNSAESSPKPYLPVTHIDDSYVEPNNHRQYISSTVAPTTSEESVVDIKPVTRRPAIRTRRPITSSNEQTNDRYHARVAKRPDVTTSRPTRIRGRTRRPTVQSAESQNVYSHSKTNELDNNSSEETVVKTRQRLTSRGKSHFQNPRGDKTTVEPEEDNYPVSFLQAHGVQQSSPSTISYTTVAAASTQQPVVLTTPSATPRPTFQLTIEPEDSEEEYQDQVPYSSNNQPRVANKEIEEGLEESQFSTKFVEKPANFNYIGSEEKSSTTEKLLELNTTENPVTVTEDVSQTTTSEADITTTEFPTTESSTETITEKSKSRRRGMWKLVKTRPIADEFESAESQNIPSIFNDNQFTFPEKPLRKYKIVQRIQVTTEPIQPETTTTTAETTFRPDVTTVKPEPSSTTGNILAPLLEMFGYNSEQHLIEQEVDATTTTNPTIFNTLLDEVESTTLSINNSTELPLVNEVKIMNYSDMMQDKEISVSDKAWKNRIIGTSTTTEISHETEICYRGRCVKSASTEENSEEQASN